MKKLLAVLLVCICSWSCDAVHDVLYPCEILQSDQSITDPRFMPEHITVKGLSKGLPNTLYAHPVQTLDAVAYTSTIYCPHGYGYYRIGYDLAGDPHLDMAVLPSNVAVGDTLDYVQIGQLSICRDVGGTAEPPWVLYVE